MLKKIFFITLGVGSLLATTGVAVLLWLIVYAPGEAIQQENIEKILAVESPVYYRDGRNKIGVFFEQAHRQYIPYDKIPQDFINALVAAEDRSFFQHYGVDFQGVARALWANIRAGRVVQGGSTLTQQTAKNLFKRKERSIQAKLKELLYAWRLEYHYPKEKILEFYANQFYVSGNGRGLGVAARYYFDKSVDELNLLESAFIAGSVKRPNYYNPFIKRDPEAVKSAKARAKTRVAYVLKQMYQLKMIDAQRYQDNIDRDIPFQQGRMTYSLNTIMDLVKSGLAEPEVEAAFSQHGIDNVSTSGIRVITTVEKDLQESALFALRKELSRLDVRLNGYNRDDLQKVYEELPFGGNRDIAAGSFLVGRIVAVDTSGASPHVDVSFGKSEAAGEVQGQIDETGLMNLLEPLMKYEKQRWTRAGPADLPVLLGRLKAGDLVYVSVREADSFAETNRLDLEKYPELQGAVLAMRDGTIRAMVGGMENRYFNRATMAKRPMGSVIKPLVYCAALQLGWNSADILNNQRNVFVYQDMPYFPRPDHESPHRGVSMNWAGVHSENLATVWLLYHLCDRLAPAQFQEIVNHLGLGSRPDESYYQYSRRIRDKYGVVVDEKALLNAAFDMAVATVEPDLLFAGKLDEYNALKLFHYGNNFDAFSAEIDDELEKLEGETKKEEGSAEKRKGELLVRQEILQRNFLRYMTLKENMIRLTAERDFDIFGDGALPTNLYHDPAGTRYIYTEAAPGEGWQAVGREELDAILAPLTDEERKDFRAAVFIDGVLSAETIDLLNDALMNAYHQLAASRPYDAEVLYHVRDFKVMTGLQYVTSLCRTFGIESQLDPVLSFPLGSNVVSVFEVAKAYEAMGRGVATFSSDQGANPGLALIDRIEDNDGDVIYAPDRHLMPVVDPRISLQIVDILRNVVKFGTGRYADRNVRMHSRDPEKEQQLAVLDMHVPVMGKTGTANRFTNAAFAGIVPGVGERGGLSVSDGYAVAAYVGFDDNKPMVRTSTHISGASGALPVWSELANAIFLERDYAGKMDLADLSFSGATEVPLNRPELGQMTLRVDPARGGAVESGEGGGPSVDSPSDPTITTFGAIASEGEFVPERFFQPYWQIKEN